MTCDDLNYLAEEAIGNNELPFFASQLTYPGDWRTYSNNSEFVSWVKYGSRKRVRMKKHDYSELEVLLLDKSTGKQDGFRARISVNECKINPEKTKSVTIHFRNLHVDEAPVNRTEKAEFTGTSPLDHLARIICGYQDYPAKNVWEEMAQKWKTCQIQGKPAAK